VTGTSGANLSAIQTYNAENHTNIVIRQVKYLNKVIEQDHLAIKRIIRGMLGSNHSVQRQSRLTKWK
jgi:putative transposase